MRIIVREFSVRHRVSVRLYPERVVVVADHDVIAEHPRAVDRDQVSYDW